MAGRKRKSGPGKLSDPLHPLKEVRETGQFWHWPSVVDVIEDRYLGVAADLPMWEILEAPYIDQAGNEWPMPDRISVYKAMARDPEIKERVEQIKQARSMALDDTILGIVRNVQPVIETERGYVPNSGGVQLAKLQVETYRKIQGTLNPRDYGNKQQVEHSGRVENSVEWSEVFKDGGAPKPKGDGT